MMPDMDGYETMQQIRQRPSSRDLPLIAVTAKAMKGDRQKCLEAGASDYISKPVDIDLLLALLRVWVGAPEAAAGGGRRIAMDGGGVSDERPVGEIPQSQAGSRREAAERRRRARRAC